jgi:uncharacterized protein YecE (DUF72 family)
VTIGPRGTPRRPTRPPEACGFRDAADLAPPILGAYTGFMGELKIGTCSWNYDSWVGLVYSRACGSAAAYLPEYSKKYGTAEIDSWFYRMPSAKDAAAYRDVTGDDFRFTCKAPNELTLTRLRGKGDVENPNFLSPVLYAEFLERIEPLAPRMDAVMLEFEYMNKAKMASLEDFLERLGTFLDGAPRGLPLAIECRNGNYMKREYFSFLREREVIHVFSERQYMPRLAALYREFGDLLVDSVVIRLLGGDRKEIKEASGERWDRILSPQPDLPLVAGVVKDLMVRGKKVTVNVNNHYEGSAPLTIDRLLGLLASSPEEKEIPW